MLKLPRPHVGIVRGHNRSLIVVARWWNFGLDILRTPEWTLLQYGAKNMLPLTFICLVRRGCSPPPYLRSVRWKITHSWKRLLMGSTHQPVKMTAIFNQPNTRTNQEIPHERRLYGETRT